MADGDVIKLTTRAQITYHLSLEEIIAFEIQDGEAFLRKQGHNYHYYMNQKGIMGRIIDTAHYYTPDIKKVHGLVDKLLAGDCPAIVCKGAYLQEVKKSILGFPVQKGNKL